MAKAQSTNQITGTRKWWALATVMLTMFFSSMDQTVVSTAIPTIIGDLKGFNLYAWVFSAYMMASAVTVPIYGKLSDVFGRKPFYLFGLVLFAIGSAISGMAHTMMHLILARTFQGIGAGAMMSMPRATIGDIFTPKERGKWMGALGAVFGLSSIIGPALGGWITDSFSWRWVFYINLPFAALAIIGVIFTLPKVRTEQQAKVDWIGSFLLVIGLLPALLGFTWAGTKYPWGSPVEIGLFAGGVVILAIFLLYERRAASPVIAPYLFKNRIFSTSLVLGVLVSMSMFGSLMFLPLYVQGVVGMNAEQSGWVMSPMMLSFIIGSVTSGMIMSKTGRYKVLAITGAIVGAVGSYMLTRLDINTHYPYVVVCMVVLGIGIGSLMSLLNVAVQNAFPYEVMGTVNATQQFVGSLGGVIASPIFGSILAQGFQNKLTTALPAGLANLKGSLANVQPQALLTSEAQKQLAQQFNKFGPIGHQLYVSFIHAVKVALTSGMNRLFEVGFVFAVLCFLVAFVLPDAELKGKEYFQTEKGKERARTKPDGELLG
jgi:EmrB/QacA subfamily drug resistance transporter